MRQLLSSSAVSRDLRPLTKEEASKALNDQYGGDQYGSPIPGHNLAVTPGLKLTKLSNAYMLVYVRESDKDQIICDVSEKDIAEHLRVRLKKEQDEKERKRKEKAEAHLFTVVKLATSQDAAAQVGGELFFDLVDHEKCRHFRVVKQTPFAEFKRHVAAELGVPVERQRYWLWAKRQNQTFRPNRALQPDEEAQTVVQVRDSTTVASKTPAAVSDLMLLLEVVSDAEAEAAAAAAASPSLTTVPMMDGEFPASAVPGGAGAARQITAPLVPDSHILLFFKLYDPRLQTMRFLGHLLLEEGSRMIDNKDKLLALAGAALRLGEDVALYEEIKYEPAIYCEKVEWRNPLKSSLQLGDGDIIVIQPVIPQQELHEVQVRFATVPEFLEFIRSRQRVIFRELANPREDKLTLDLNKSMSYDAVTAALAEALQVADPSTLRLTTHNCYSHAPKLPSLAHRGVESLSDMLVHFNSSSDILYYEVLDMPLPELEGTKSLKIAFHGHDTKHVETFNIRMPRESCVADLLAELRHRLGDKVTPGLELRLLELWYSKIYKVLPGMENIEGIDDQYWTVRAEEVAPEAVGLQGGVVGAAEAAGVAAEQAGAGTAAGAAVGVDVGAGAGAGEGMGVESGKLIHVCHFYRDTPSAGNHGIHGTQQVHNFGDPFLIQVGADELLSSIQRRIQAKLGTPDEEFDAWNWAYHSSGRPDYLAADDVVASWFARPDAYGVHENYLGMEHEDQNPRKTAAANNSNRSNRYGGYNQKPVKIYN
jgi:ubiquitin carboxyl-terminal hydrolase 7